MQLLPKKLTYENVLGSKTFSFINNASNINTNDDIKIPNYDEHLADMMKKLNLQNDDDNNDLKRKEDKNDKLREINLAHVKHYDPNDPNDPYETPYPIPNVMHDTHDQILITVEIENEKILCLLDTGADICVLGKKSEHIWNKVKDQKPFRQINIRTAGGEIHPGQVKKLKVSYDNETRYLQFVFAPTIAIPIALGMNFCNLWDMKLMRLKKKSKIVAGKDTDNMCTLEELDDEEERIYDDVEEEFPLTPSELLKIKKAMNLFNFSDGESIGCQKILQHKIDTGNNAPIFSLPYRYNPTVIDKIRPNIKRWLMLNIIEPSVSNWRLPIVVVTKKDKSLRLCLDARRLNAITKRDCHIPPNVLHKIDSLPHKAKYYLRLDLNEAFLQTELALKDRKKTAFSIPGIGEFQFIRMPFGLVNSPATQSRLMEMIFNEIKTEYIMHYLDDVIIMGTSLDHLISNIEKVAKILNSHNLTVSKKKTSKVLKRIRILGHIIDEKGIHTDIRKIKVIEEWPLPKTGKELQRFLGFANWYRRFIKNYASLSGPLYEISKKRSLDKFWNEDKIKCFESIKEKMIKSPVLRTPDWSKPMIIQADASDLGIGAVLTQKDDNNNEYVIEYYSYKFSNREKKYAPTEKEMLAVLKAIRHFKYYIEFNELTIYSDHHALQYLMNMKVMSGRLSRWILELQPFVNKIKHRAGIDMTVPDALSRIYEIVTKIPIKSRLTWYDEFVDELRENPDNYPQYYLDGNQILKKIPWNRNVLGDDYRIFPHPESWNKLIKLVHEKTIHAGIKATYYELKRNYWWPEMRLSIKNYIQKCKICASIKFPNYKLRAPLGKFKIPKDTMTSLSIDIKGALPTAGPHKFKYIVTVIDLLSRYGWTKRLANVTSDKIIKFMREIFNEQRKCPKEIYHDNGSVFVSHEFKNFLSENNIKSLCTAIYHPQANTVERFNRSLTEAIRIKIIEDPMKQHRWSNNLNEIVWEINSRINDVTDFSPYEVHYGRFPDKAKHSEPPVNDDKHKIIKEIAYKRSLIRYLQNARQFANRSLNRTFNPNEIVMIRKFYLSNSAQNVSGKLFPPWNVGKIIRKCESYAYEVMDINGKISKINIKMIKGLSYELQQKLSYLFENLHAGNNIMKFLSI